MDAGNVGELSPRGRRALPLIAAAIAVIVIAGALYLRATAPPARTAYVAPSPMATLPSAYAAVYDFVTPSTGWALVAETSQTTNLYWIFKTTDGARHWKAQYTSNVDSIETSLKFFDAQDGVLLFSYPTPYFLRTKDGGAHWQQISTPPVPVALSFADPAHGWALGGMPLTLSATDNGGSEWHAVSWPSDAAWAGGSFGIDAMPFRADGEGWLGAASSEPIVYLTTDGGSSWNAVHIPAPAPAPSPVPGPKQYPLRGFPAYETQVRLLPGNGVMVYATDAYGNQPTWVTFDRGSTWREVPQPPNPMRYDDIAFLDSTHWWAFRFGYLFKTMDAGVHWAETKVAPLIDGWDYGVAHPIDSQHAWVTMQSSIIPGVRLLSTALSMTSDGGASWHAVNAPAPG